MSQRQAKPEDPPKVYEQQMLQNVNKLVSRGAISYVASFMDKKVSVVMMDGRWFEGTLISFGKSCSIMLRNVIMKIEGVEKPLPSQDKRIDRTVVVIDLGKVHEMFEVVGKV